ncbi:hypothetical protein B0T24DRAFT_17800 [Lasiosphaeria ovina]|uniref:RING-type domain-containing protein n=1 Tax=Lasiosphaeria ovina TaxID=92902 RepID=A0AAE0TWY8_9PEZI|nr:hypothetical protein B0T24DRAFT_17800 [Lasiosphaeria ovina]
MPAVSESTKPNLSSGPPATSIVLSITLSILMLASMCVARRSRSPLPISESAHARAMGAAGRSRARSEVLEAIPVVKYGRGTPPPTGNQGLRKASSLTSGPRDRSASLLRAVNPTRRPRLLALRAPRQWYLGRKTWARSLCCKANASVPDAEEGLAVESCAICTEDFTHGTDVRRLPCTHLFHPACIDPWFLDFSATCPLCRVEIVAGQTGPLVAEPRRAAIAGESRG